MFRRRVETVEQIRRVRGESSRPPGRRPGKGRVRKPARVVPVVRRFEPARRRKPRPVVVLRLESRSTLVGVSRRREPRAYILQLARRRRRRRLRRARRLRQAGFEPTLRVASRRALTLVPGRGIHQRRRDDRRTSRRGLVQERRSALRLGLVRRGEEPRSHGGSSTGRSGGGGGRRGRPRVHRGPDRERGGSGGGLRARARTRGDVVVDERRRPIRRRRGRASRGRRRVRTVHENAIVDVVAVAARYDTDTGRFFLRVARVRVFGKFGVDRLRRRADPRRWTRNPVGGLRGGELERGFGSLGRVRRLDRPLRRFRGTRRIAERLESFAKAAHGGSRRSRGRQQTPAAIVAAARVRFRRVYRLGRIERGVVVRVRVPYHGRATTEERYRGRGRRGTRSRPRRGTRRRTRRRTRKRTSRRTGARIDAGQRRRFVSRGGARLLLRLDRGRVSFSLSRRGRGSNRGRRRARGGLRRRAARLGNGRVEGGRGRRPRRGDVERGGGGVRATEGFVARERERVAPRGGRELGQVRGGGRDWSGVRHANLRDGELAGPAGEAPIVVALVIVGLVAEEELALAHLGVANAGTAPVGGRPRGLLTVVHDCGKGEGRGGGAARW